MFTIFRQQHLPKLAWARFSKQLQPSRSISVEKTPNDITLIGSVHSKARQISNDTMQFYFRTVDSPNSYTVHDIQMSSAEWNNYKTGQPEVSDNFIILGNLRARQYERQDGKKQTSIHIKARWVYPCSTYGSRSNDALNMNRVDIMAQICFDIKNFEKYSVFNLAHHYKDRFTLAERTIFLSVFAKDEELRRYVRDNLKRLDNVRVKGLMEHSAFVDTKGKKRFAARITAESINKSINIM